MNIKKGPWTIIDSKEIYKNPWIDLREDKVIKPDGTKGIFGVVEMKPGVSILPIDSKGNVYLVEEYRYAIGRITLQTASGGIDKGETKQDAAKRELREETGIIANKWIDLGVVDPFTMVIASPNYMFLASELELSTANPEGAEKIKVVRISMKKAIKWVMESKITHSATATLILKAKDYLGYND